MSETKENTTKVVKVNLEDFFTSDHERDGIWFEPKIKGIPCGFEFLVTGFGSDENAVNDERFEKENAKAKEIKDSLERQKKLGEIDAKRIAALVKGIRAAEGTTEVDFGGKPIEYSVPLIQEIMLKSPLIKLEVAKFSADTTNFIIRKKND